MKKIICLNFILQNVLISFSSCSQQQHDMSCLGDSITWGYNGNERNNRMPNPYPLIIQSKISNFYVDNLANNGAFMSTSNKENNIVDQVNQIHKNTKVISIMGGTNDYLWNGQLGNYDDTNTSTMYGATQYLITHIKQQFPSTFLFFITPIKVLCKTGPNNLGHELREYVEAIYYVCNKNNIDIFDAYNLCDPTEDFNEQTSDKLHPSQKFVNEKLGPMLSEFVIQHLQK